MMNLSVLAAQNPSQPGSASGLREIGPGADDMRTAIDGLHRNVDEMSGYLTPLRNFVDTTPDRGANAICSLVLRVVQPVDSVVRSTRELSTGAGRLTTGSSTATTAFAGLPPTLQSMRDVLDQAKAATRDLRGVINSIAPQIRRHGWGGDHRRHRLRDHEVCLGWQHGDQHRAGRYDRRDRAPARYPDRPDFPDAVASGATGTLVLVATPAQPSPEPKVRRKVSDIS
jgi:hypothetical protein